jgi:UDP-glucuronate 4-epimerase
LAATLPNLPFGSSYNIGSGHTTSINELLATLQNILHTSLVPLHSTKRPGDVLTAFADISKAARELSFSAKVSLHQGLQKFIDWYLSESKPQPADLVPQSISI